MRKVVYVGGIVACSAGCVSAAFLAGTPLALTMAAWGVAAGGAGLLFVVPLEMDRVEPTLAGSAVGVATTAGCFLFSALLFTAVRETGQRRTWTERSRSSKLPFRF